MKRLARIFFSSFFLICLFIQNGISQPVVDSIRYNETDQSILIVYLNNDISYTPTSPMTTTDWRVYHGSTQYPSVTLLSRGFFDPAYSIKLKLPSAITYDESQEGIEVSYLGTGPVISGSAGNLASFPAFPAFNTLALNCDAFKLNRGLETLVDKNCSPITVNTEITYYLKSEYLNSIFYDPADVYIRILWGDGDVEYQTPLVSDPGSTTLKGNFIHAYPDDPTFCLWSLISNPGISGVGNCGGAGLTQQQSILNYSTDEEGSGYFTMHRDTIRICIGQDFSETFSDATLFNCRKDIEPDFPNIGERWVRFTYGTNSGGGVAIPDILIDGGTVSFPYVGTPIKYDSADTPFPNAESLPISHASNMSTDAVGQVFEVMLENWGPCNSIYESKPPIVTYSCIQIVDGPIANAGSNLSVCAGDSAKLNGSLERTAVIGVWSTTTGDGSFFNPTSPDGAEYSPGPADIANGGVWLTLTASDAGAACPNHSDSIWLTIDPIPAKATLTATNPRLFCFDNGATSVELSSSLSPSGNYEWYKDGNLQSSLNSRTITLDQVSHSGEWTVRVLGNTSNSCPGPESDPVEVQIYALPATTNPIDKRVCDDDNMTNGNVSFSVTTGGAAHTIQWQRSDDSGLSWENITGTTTPNDGCSYEDYTTDELQIKSADYPMNGFLFRAVLTSNSGNCPVYSSPATLTVHPVPTIITSPVPADVCEEGNTWFAVEADIANGSIDSYQWRRNNSDITPSTDGGIYSGFDTDTLKLENVPFSLNGKNYRVIITSNEGCSVRSGNKTLTVNPLANILVPPRDKTICEGSTTSFTIVTDGNPSVSAYRWEISSDNGISWSDVSGALYENENTATLSLSNVPLSFHNNRYRVVLSTPGSCDITSDEATLSVNATPSASISPASVSPLCAGDVINLNGNPAGGTPAYTHQWSGDTDPLSGTEISNPVFTAPSTTSLSSFDLSYTVKDMNNCTASDDVSVWVNPAVTVNPVASKTEVCAGTAVNLKGNPGGGTPEFDHSWSGTAVGALSADNIQSPVFTAPAVAVRTVFSFNYTATDSKGCQKTGSVDIAVNPLPSISITPAAPSPLCYNGSLTLDGNAGGGTAPYTHSWTGNISPLNATDTETPGFIAPSVSALTDYDLTYTLTDDKACTASGDITIQVLPHLESAVLSGNASICGGSSTNLYVEITGGIAPFTVVLNNGLSDITVSSYESGDPISTGNLLNSTSYSLVSVVDANGCSASSLSGTAEVIVGSVPLSAQLRGGKEICLSSEAVLFADVTGGAPPYILEIDALGTIYTYYPGDSVSAGFPGTGSYNFNLLSVKDTCGNTISGASVSGGNTQTFLVSPPPDISATTNNKALLCNNSSTDIELITDLPGTKFKWTIDDGGGINWVSGKAPFTDSIVDAAGTEKIEQLLQHTMDSPVEVEYTISSFGPDTSFCPGNSLTIKVTVEPTLEIIATDQLICNNGSFDVDIATAGSGSYGEKYVWTVSMPAGVSGPTDGPTEGVGFDQNLSGSVSNSNDTAATVVFTITPYTLDNAGNLLCAGAAKNLNIIVEPEITISAQNDTICNNSFTNIDVNTGAGASIGGRYSWTIVMPDSVSGGSDGPAGGQSFDMNISQKLSNSGVLPKLVVYTITPYTTDSTGNLSCPGSSIDVQILVEPDVDIIAADKRLCYNSSTNLAISTSATGSRGMKYNWTVSAPSELEGESNGPVDGQHFSQNISQTLATTSYSADTAIYSITGYTTDSYGNLACGGDTKEVRVIAEPRIVVTSNDKTICSGSSTNLDVNSLFEGSLGTKYSWTASAPAGITGAADDSLNGNFFDTNLSQTLVNLTKSPQIVTYTLTGYCLDESGLLSCAGPSIDVDITVEPVVGILAKDTTICSNSSPMINIDTDAEGSFDEKYTWTVSSPLSVAGAENAPPEGASFSQLIDNTLINSGLSHDTVVYTVRGYTINATGDLLCYGPSSDVKVIVEPRAVLSASDTTICNNTSTNLNVNTLFSASNSLRYSWTVAAPDSVLNAEDGPVTGLSFSENINQTLRNISHSAQTLTYTITPYTTNAAGELRCAGEALDVDVTIEPTVSITVQDKTICFGDTLILPVVTNFSSSNGIKYTWSVDAPIAITGEEDGPAEGRDISLPFRQILRNSSVVPEEANYTFSVYTTDAAGDIVCPGVSDEALITVNPNPVALPENRSLIIPTGGYANILMQGNVAGSEFGWRVVNPATTGATDGSSLSAGDSIYQQLFNTGNTSYTVVYRIAPAANSCPGDSVDVFVRIDPKPSVSIINRRDIICSEDSMLIEIESELPGTTFSWKVVDPDTTGAKQDTLAGPYDGVKISHPLINNDSLPAVVEYIVTPTGPAPLFVTGEPRSASVTVYPSPRVIADNLKPVVCDGTKTRIKLNSQVTGTTFTWTVTDPSLGASGASASVLPLSSGDSISQVLYNTGNTPYTITYHITPKGPSPLYCDGQVSNIEVTVNPTPQAYISNSTPVICSNEQTAIKLDASVSNTRFEYFIADPKGTGALNGSGNMLDSISQTLINSGRDPVDIIYEIIPYGPGASSCRGSSVYKEVSVNPMPIEIEILGEDSVCESEPGLVFQVELTPNSYYTWNVPESVGEMIIGGSGVNKYAVVVNAAGVSGRDSLRVHELNKYGCSGDTVYKALTIVEKPTVSDIIGPRDICANSQNVRFSVPNNPGSTYQWFVPTGSGVVSNPVLNEVFVNVGTLSGQVRVIETSAGSCISFHNPLNLNVNPVPIATINADKLGICEGEEVTFTAGPFSASNNYEFFINGISAQNGPSNVFISDELEDDDEVNVMVTNAELCSKLSPSLSLSVQETPEVTLSSSIPGNAFCENTEVTFEATSAVAVSYKFFVNDNPVQNRAINFYRTTNLDDGDEVSVEVTSALGCTGTSNIITNQVYPLPDAVLAGDNTICPGEPAILSLSLHSGTPPFDIFIDNGVGNFTLNGMNGNISTFPALSTSYKLVYVEDDRGCISDVLSGHLHGTATIVLRDTVEITEQPVDASACQNSGTRFSVYASGDGLRYQWEYSTDPVSGFTPVDGSLTGHQNFTSSSLDIDPVISEYDGYYYRVKVYSSFCPENDYSDTVRLRVRYNPVTLSNPANQDVCVGKETGFGVDAGLTENPVYQWQLSTDNGYSYQNLLDTAIYRGTGTDSLSLITTYPGFDQNLYRVIVSGECGEAKTSAPARLNILFPPAIIEEPVDTTVCANHPVQFRTVTGGEISTLRWQVDMNDGEGWRSLSDTTDIYSGSETNILTVLNAGDRFHEYKYKLLVSGTCAPAVETTPVTLYISSYPEIRIQPKANPVCEFGTTEISVEASGTNLFYTWQEYDGENWTDLEEDANYSGVETPVLRISNTPRQFDNKQYRVLINGACSSILPSDHTRLQVKTSPVLISDIRDTLICEEHALEFGILASGSDLNYQWQGSKGGSFINLIDGDIYSGVSDSILQITSVPLSLDYTSFRVVVSGACPAPVNSGTALLRVSAKPEIIAPPSPATICEGENISFSSQYQGQNVLHQWEINRGGSWETLADDSVHMGSESATLTLQNVPESLNGARYRIVLFSSCEPVYSAGAVLTVHQNPRPEITGTGAFPFICAGTEITLDGNPSGGSLNYSSHSWSGDTSPLSNTNQQATRFTSRIKRDYYINYTVTDSRGCSGTTSTVIRNDKPLAEFISDAEPSCGDIHVNFTNSTTGAESYTWNWNDGSDQDTSYNASHVFGNENTSGLVEYYNVSMVATSSNGCRDTARQIITVYPVISPEFTLIPDTACQPVMVTLTTQSGASAYEWDFGDGQHEWGSYSIKHLYTNLSNEVKVFDISLTTTSYYECTATAVKKLTVYPMPTPNFTVSPAVQTYPDTTVSITNKVEEGPWNYLYRFGDESTSTEENPVHRYSGFGTYNITQIVKTGECSDSAVQTVVIEPPYPLAGFDTPEAGCTPHTVRFRNQSDYAQEFYWEFGDGGISDQKDPEYTYHTPGTYTVSLTARGPGGSETRTKEVEVWPSPDIRFENVPDSVHVNDKPVRFLNYTGLASNYLWDFGDYQEGTEKVSGYNASSQKEPFHIYEYTGWKDVKLIAWNDYCRDSLIKENAVFVIPSGELSFPNVFRPNPNGPNGGYYQNLPLSEINTVFHPGIINEISEYRLLIYSRWGELVFETTDVWQGWDGYMDGKLANQGVYVWKVEGKYSYGKLFQKTGDVTLLH